MKVLFETEKNNNPLWDVLTLSMNFTSQYMNDNTKYVSAVVFVSGWYNTEGGSPATDEDNCMDKS